MCLVGSWERSQPERVLPSVPLRSGVGAEGHSPRWEKSTELSLNQIFSLGSAHLISGGGRGQMITNEANIQKP